MRKNTKVFFRSFFLEEKKLRIFYCGSPRLEDWCWQFKLNCYSAITIGKIDLIFFSLLDFLNSFFPLDEDDQNNRSSDSKHTLLKLILIWLWIFLLWLLNWEFINKGGNVTWLMNLILNCLASILPNFVFLSLSVSKKCIWYETTAKLTSKKNRKNMQ